MVWEETESQDNSSRLFSAEHYQRLLNKIIVTLKYQDEVKEKPKSAATEMLDARAFKSPSRLPTVSPFPEYFSDVLKERVGKTREWKLPAYQHQEADNWSSRLTPSHP